LRFAVRRLGNPYASPRSHRTPCGDVLGCVHISVACVPAGRAAEDGLALARLSVDLPAGGTTLRSVSRMDPLNSSWGLLLKASDKHSPGILQYSSVQGCFLGDLSTRLSSRATCRARHRPNIERFDADQIKVDGQARRDFLAPILTHTRLTTPQPGYVALHSCSPVGSSLATSQASLQPEQPALSSRAKLSNGQEFTGAQGHANLDAPVYSDRQPVARWRDWRRDHREGYVPASDTVQRHPERLCRLRQRTRQAEPHPSRLRYPDKSEVPVEFANVGGFESDNPESLVFTGFSPARWAMGSRHVVSDRLGKVSQSLLLYHLASRTQPFVFCSRFGELATLSQVSRCAFPTRTPPQMLLNGEVPYETRMRAVFPQNYLLRGSWVQAVSGHESNVTATSDILGETEPAASLGKVPRLAAAARR
jgi:hypothetical protein